MLLYFRKFAYQLLYKSYNHETQIPRYSFVRIVCSISKRKIGLPFCRDRKLQLQGRLGG